MTTSQVIPLEDFDAFVERLKDMIPFTALAPVDEEAILKSKFMPKRSKIVSGKVIAAVEQSRNKASSSAVAEPKAVEHPVETVTEKAEATVVSGDVRVRFQQRKEELETSRHANDPNNIRKAEKRRAAEEKKNKHQQKKLADSSSTSKGSDAAQSDSDAKRVKSGLEEGDFVFSRVADADKKDSKKKSAAKVISNPKQALQKLQAEKDKIEKLRGTDAEKATVLQEKIELKKALQKAQGIAVKDDVNLLKKSIQRREKEKNKSRENWTKKKSELQESKDKRQTKRNENIQARIDAKKNKKMGIKVKKPQKSGKPAQKGKFNKKK